MVAAFHLILLLQLCGSFECRVNCLAFLSSWTTYRVMQPTATLYDQGFGPNICMKPEATSADVTLQKHISRVKETRLYQTEAVCLYVRKLHTAEITSPAALRAVLHHGGSWNNDTTSEPQPGPDQMVDFLIKYLSGPSNWPTSVWLFDGHHKVGCWSSTNNTVFRAEH